MNRAAPNIAVPNTKENVMLKEPDADEIARRCAEAMYEKDRTARALGMTVEAVGPGTARISMKVRETMLNGHDIAHGGMIFTLADTAFAYACNAYNKVTVARFCSITFVSPGRAGDVLTAIAEERSRSGRNGIYDVDIVNQDGTLIAAFRGNSATIKGETVPGLTEEK